jgi:site-specific DNA-methyltransferase (adenine-specific)
VTGAAPAELLEVLDGRRRWCVLEGEALAQLVELPAETFDAVVTDPPYSSGGFTRGDRTSEATAKYSKRLDRNAFAFTGDNRDQHSFEYWCVLWGFQALRVLKTGAPFAQWCDWRQLPITTHAIQAAGFVWRGIFTWNKDKLARPQMGRFSSNCEYAPWGTKGPSLDLEEVGCLPGSITCSPVSGAEREHLTEKPLEVMTATVAICRPAGLVLDPFAGSGSTGVAAIRSGRRFVGVELDPGYAQVARERLEAESLQMKVADYRAGQLGLQLSTP